MKLTAGELFNAYVAAQALSKEKLPLKGAYWLNRILRKLEPEYLAVSTQRNALIKKHGEEKDGNFQVTGAGMAAFIDDIEQVFSIEIEVDCPTVKLDLLGDTEIDGGLLVPLDKFIEE